MLRGIIAGTFWGVLLGGLTLALTSQLADWRDLTPALTQDVVETVDGEEFATVDPSDGARDAPVVSAGTGALRPRLSGTPDTLPLESPDPRPAQAQAPANVPLPQIPELAEIAGSVPETGAVPLAGMESRPATGTLQIAAAPEAGRAPAQIGTEAALTPARFAPTAQDTVGGLARLSRAADAPAPPGKDQSLPAPRLAALVTTPEPAGRDQTPAVPDQVPAPAIEDLAGGVEAPETSDTLAAPAGESDMPEVAPTAGIAAPQPAEESIPSIAPAPEAPGGLAAASPESETPTEAVAEVATEPAPVAEPPQPATAPEVIEAAEAHDAQTPVEEEAPRPVPSAVTGSAPEPETPDAVVAPEIRAEDAAPSDAAPAPIEVAEADTAPGQPATGGALTEAHRLRVSSESSLPGVRIRRLPSVGDASPDREPAAPAAPAEADGAEPDADAPALVRNAVEFDRPDGAVLISVILLDPSAVSSDRLPEPMTVAIDARDPDAASLAEAQRAAGREVALVPDIPRGAQAQDAAVAISVNVETVPAAVAFVDPAGDRFQSNRAATGEVVASAGEGGYGVVTLQKGFNGAQRAAERAGVPATTAFRRLEADLTDRGAIARALDQAAFRARTEGDLVILAEGSEDQLAGILGWALENRRKGVALAPLSAVLGAEN